MFSHMTNHTYDLFPFLHPEFGVKVTSTFEVSRNFNFAGKLAGWQICS